MIDGTAPTMNKISTRHRRQQKKNRPMCRIRRSSGQVYPMQTSNRWNTRSTMGHGRNWEPEPVEDVELPAGTITGNGQHKIAVRAVDKAGNVKEEVLDYYYKDNTAGFDGYLPKDGTLTLRKDYAKNLISWETDKVLNDTVYYRIYKRNREGLHTE